MFFNFDFKIPHIIILSFISRKKKKKEPRSFKSNTQAASTQKGSYISNLLSAHWNRISATPSASHIYHRYLSPFLHHPKPWLHSFLRPLDHNSLEFCLALCVTMAHQTPWRQTTVQSSPTLQIHFTQLPSSILHRLF